VTAYAEAGMDGHLAKPIEVARLLAVVQSAWLRAAAGSEPEPARGAA
jgi:CheY-like chemotaxis protein